MNDPLTPRAVEQEEVEFARRLASHAKPLLVLAGLFGAFWTALYLQFTADDAYLSFRYGANLVLHGVWNWNPPNPLPARHEEAYTSAIYTVLSVLPALLHVSAALFFKLLGLTSTAMLALRVYRLAAHPFPRLLALLLLGIHPFVWMHSYSGLETPLYMLLLFELAIATQQLVRREDRTDSPSWLYTLAVLLPLTRPEGLLFSIAALAVYWRLNPQASRYLRSAACALGLGLAYLFARWNYFVHLFPNPYYVKLHAATWSIVFETLLDNLYLSIWYLFTLLLVLLLSRKPIPRVFAATGLGMALLLFLPHAMTMNFADRFYFQLTLPVLLLFLVEEDILPIARLATVAAAVFVLGLSPSFLSYGLHYYPALLRGQIDLGRRLAPFAARHSLLTGEAGAIPYYSHWTAYDPLGLGTNEFARHLPTQADLAALHPDLIFVFADTPDEPDLDHLPDADPASPTAPANHAVLAYLGQARTQYRFAAAAHCNGYYLLSYLRYDTGDYDAIRATLQENAATSRTAHATARTILLQHYVPWSR